MEWMLEGYLSLNKNFMRIFFSLLAILILNFSCSPTNNIPAIINIQDIKFLINPYISYRNGDFYLVYQVEIDGRTSNVRLQIGEKKVNDKFYYLLLVKVVFQNMII